MIAQKENKTITANAMVAFAVIVFWLCASSSVFSSVGHLIEHIDFNNQTTRYEYNEAGQIAKEYKADGSTVTYTYNGYGYLTQAVETVNGQTRTVNYTYDDTGKLLQEKTQEGIQIRTTDYQYDKVGNRVKKTENGVETSYLYNGNDQLTEETTNGQAIHYRYDANGNLTQKQTPQGTIAYTWDSANRLTQIDDQITGKTITYRLDAEGRRIGKTVKEGSSTTETQYLVDPARPYSEIVQARTRVNNGAWQDTLYIHTPDGVGDLIGQTTGTESTFVLQDGQGSSRLAVDNDGTVKEIITFDAFGNRVDGFGKFATDPTTINHLYVGEHYDQESGFYHLRARDYDPATGRFAARDEFQGIKKIPLSTNPYLYGHADPVNQIDPSGYFAIASIAVTAMPNFSIRLISGSKQITLTAVVTCAVTAAMSTIANVNPLPGFEVCSSHKMRIQLQRSPKEKGGGTTETHGGNVIYGDPRYGVKVTQIEKRLVYIYYSDIPSWWPGDLNFIGMTASISKQLRGRVPFGVSGPVKSVATANSIYIKHEYRIDVDNLTGHNLRFY